MQGNQWSQIPNKNKQKGGKNSTSAFNFTTSSNTSKSSSNSKLKIKPGSTVGFLVYLPATKTSSTIDQLLTNTNVNTNTSTVKNESHNNSLLTTNNTNNANNNIIDTNTISPLSMSPEPPVQVRNDKNLIDTNNMTTATTATPYVFRIHIDGVPCEFPTECNDAIQHMIMTDIEKLSTPLFPTVSLLSNNTRIWCRFCEADMVYRNRQIIGVENNVRVYCVDGSILIHESE